MRTSPFLKSVEKNVQYLKMINSSALKKVKFQYKYLKFQIKFLKTKEGTAMVQMGDGVSVERCVQNLNNVTVGDYTLTLA